MFSDLECDYINPIDLCNKLNQVSSTRTRHTSPRVAHSLDHSPQFVLPENIAHALLTILFLISGQWTAFILNAPLLAFNVNKCVSGVSRAQSNSPPTYTARIRLGNHMYDATEIFRTLPNHKTEGFIKLGFYLLSFFYYLYRCACLAQPMSRLRLTAHAPHLHSMILALIAEES